MMYFSKEYSKIYFKRNRNENRCNSFELKLQNILGHLLAKTKLELEKLVIKIILHATSKTSIIIRRESL